MKVSDLIPGFGCIFITEGFSDLCRYDRLNQPVTLYYYNK